MFGNSAKMIFESQVLRFFAKYLTFSGSAESVPHYNLYSPF